MGTVTVARWVGRLVQSLGSGVNSFGIFNVLVLVLHVTPAMAHLGSRLLCPFCRFSSTYPDY